MIYQVQNDGYSSLFETKDAAINYSLYFLINRVNYFLFKLQDKYVDTSFDINLINIIIKFINYYNDNEFEKAIKFAEESRQFQFSFHQIEINYDLMPIAEINKELLHKINKKRTFQ